MTIQDLYAICDNLGPWSDFTVYRGAEEVFSGPYIEMEPWCYEATVTGFEIVRGISAEIHI